MLGSALAKRMSKGVGDTVEFETRAGRRSVPVAGIAAEYTAGGSSLYMEWETAKRTFGFEGVHAFLVTAKPGEAAAVAGPLRALCEAKGCLFQPQADLRAAIREMMDGVLGLLWMLLLLVFVVAAIGIVNTLAMNVMEQTRELGMLRAVALPRRRVRRMVLAEAAVLGVASLVPGAAVGLVLAWLFNLATYPLVGHHVPFAWHPGLVAGCVGVAFVTALLAGLPAARRAARLDIVRALQME